MSDIHVQCKIAAGVIVLPMLMLVVPRDAPGKLRALYSMLLLLLCDIVRLYGHVSIAHPIVMISPCEAM
jgi:hypothetical protein